MIDFLALVLIVGLATYRISRMIVAEDGPFDVLAKARHALTQRVGDTWITRGFGCVPCVSFWVSLALSVVLTGAGAGMWFTGWLAAACVAVILARRVA